MDFQHVYSLNDLEEDEPDLSHLPGAHGMGETLISTLLKNDSCVSPAWSHPDAVVREVLSAI